MLQAFIDESCDGVGDDRIFVMAGYIASIERWMALSDEWADVWQNRAPAFRQAVEFKQRNMRGSAAALKTSETLFRIAENHAEFFIVCIVRLSDVEKAHSSIDWPDWLAGTETLKNEFFIGFDHVVRGLPMFQDKLGIDHPIDVIFDNHSGKARCLQFWDIVKNYGLPSIRGLLGETPNFQDSIKSMPLQAADQLAYWARESYTSMNVEDDVRFPWERSKTMRGLLVYSKPEQIANNMRRTLAHMEGLYAKNQRLIQVLVNGGARRSAAEFAVLANLRYITRK